MLWIIRRAPRALWHSPRMRTRTTTFGDRLLNRLRDDRGDVPGWVLITIMTAGLVILLWAAAGPALSSVFEQAIERVTGF